MILAISIEAPAIPPKPRMPAISAMIRNVTTQLSMTRPPISTVWLEQQRDDERLCCRTNPASERMFLTVPGAKSAKSAVTRGTKYTPGAHGIKPVKSAAKALYAFQSCYEGSPSGPRGAIVSWAEDESHDRAEQADPSRRP